MPIAERGYPIPEQSEGTLAFVNTVISSPLMVAAWNRGLQIEVRTFLLPRVSSLNFPESMNCRGPTKYAPTNAQPPPTTCTALAPAKSRKPLFTSRWTDNRVKTRVGVALIAVGEEILQSCGSLLQVANGLGTEQRERAE